MVVAIAARPMAIVAFPTEAERPISSACAEGPREWSDVATPRGSLGRGLKSVHDSSPVGRAGAVTYSVPQIQYHRVGTEHAHLRHVAGEPVSRVVYYAAAQRPAKEGEPGSGVACPEPSRDGGQKLWPAGLPLCRS